ncbi:imidazole glycerol phosphate synthase [Salinicoccus sediminis]|uniref:Imidazole glycerol phosphate synthase subunit HisH n=1 Tax=Salinicoccus sediminis TaxID=1432562 RepID=A0A0M2SJI7_9STAP|nr:imidazole glycerol phosphate synthase subunit HisH [Salinicoccus sediminis]KKK34834.1 imidazole glycerol phosphate synthase [Salinicoccus sediminis]
MIGIVDYSLGNIQNVKNALDKLGYPYLLSSEQSELESCDTVILPGVGHFGNAMQSIESLGIKDTLLEIAGSKRIIGICLGMQLLFESSSEGNREGLGLLKGHVRRMDTPFTIPHLGWNTLNSECGSLDGRDVYFIHSYMVTGGADTIATTGYGIEVPAVVQKGSIIGIQFHPEKSGDAGLEILKTAIEGGF